MFGGSKRGRGGGGRSGGKRSLPPPAPTSSLHRPSSISTPGASIGPTSSAARDRFGTRGAVVETTNPVEIVESFDLVRGVPGFGAIVRLTPDLVDVIKQAEAQGGAARIKFDSNHNSSDNVIDVGGKEFKFTWSKELGALCDIYEEHQKGEDGHGLLVECGSAWRKLNVERILDESAKNHVKKLSEEAERQLKSRKSIVLGPANPSVKNQVKSMVAAGVDGSMRKMGWMSKKENMCKKRKVESSQVSHTAQAKSTFKSGISSNNSTKGMVSVSPKGIVSLSAQASHEQSGPGISISSVGAPEDTVSPFNINRDDIGNSEKAIPSNVVNGYMHELIVHKREVTDQPMDLRSILIFLLTAHPKGMTLKALQKVVGEVLPKSAKKIGSFIKNVATFQAPGRYFLKPELELDSSKGRVSVNGSSPGIARDVVSASESLSGEKATTGNGEQETQLENAGEGDPFKNSDGKPNDPDPYTSAIKVNNDNEGRASISSESGSGSESESDSSDSGSQLRSRSKSINPLGSGSAGSSDSESDGPSSSKEGSDVEVEIMSIDEEKDEAECKKELAKSKLWPSPRSTTTSEGEHEQITSPPLDFNDFGRGNGPDGMAHEAKGIRSSPINHCVKASESHKTGNSTNSTFSDQMIISPPDQYDKQSEKQRASHDTDKQVVNNRIGENHSIIAKDRSSLEQTDILKRNSRSKSKRVSGSEYFEDKPESVKRPKVSSSTQDMLFHQSRVANLSENSNYSSPAKPKKDLPKDPIANKIVFDENKGLNLQEYSFPEHGRTCISKNTSRIHQSPDFKRTLNVDGRLPPRTVDLNSGRVLDSTERHVDDFVCASKHVAGVNDSETESDFHLNASGEMARTDQGLGLEKQSHARKAFPDRMLPQYETKHGGQISNAVVREFKPQKTNSWRDSTVQSNNTFLIENGHHCGKTRGTSSDEELFFLSKYDRDKPELKGPIKDYSQYKEYVEEFRGKYDYYFSLNKNLENMRNDFVRVGEDLKTAKQRDMEEYYIIVRQCKEMYNQFGESHKQMKKVFILLHEELKNLKQRIKDFAQNYSKE